MGYMDNTTLMIMCLVCQQIKKLIWHGHGIHNKIIRIFELRPSEDKNYNNGGGWKRLKWFLLNMNRYCQDYTKHRMLQGYQHWKVQNVDGFIEHKYDNFIEDDELEQLTQNIRMPRILSLNMSCPTLRMSSPLPTAYGYDTLYRAISRMVPNLQQLDLSHTTSSPSILEIFAVPCPHLEIIQLNNNDEVGIEGNGCELQSVNNLKELHFDNCYVWLNHDDRIDEDKNGDTDDDDDDDDDNFLSPNLRPCRIVITIQMDSFFTNYVTNHWNGYQFETHNTRTPPGIYRKEHTVSQNMLMKFVQKAPVTLVWFRSDLSPANIRILQLERPKIKFQGQERALLAKYYNS